MNARSIISKFYLFEAWISNIRPDIIGVTESWTSGDILDSELSLDGYDLFRKDRPVARAGGGVLLYVKSSLSPVMFSPSTKFPEHVWCQISDSGGSKFLIGVCYRTPSNDIFGDCNNHDLLVDMLNELGSSNRHFLLMGDFNYRFLEWPPDLNSDSLSKEATLFHDSLDDNFLVQHITTPTRGNAILDLVITDEADMISDIEDIGKLGNSDHNALLWNTQISTDNIKNRQQVYDYSKANVAAIKSELQVIDWSHLFSNLPVDDCWKVFKGKLQDLEAKYVPKKIVNSGKSKPIWMTYRAVKAVKRRHKIFRKYKDPEHPACKKADKKASVATKQSKRSFELKLAQKIKTDKKSFFAYVKSKTKTKVKVGPLTDTQGHETRDSSRMVEIFNDQFSSIFTREDFSNFPTPTNIFQGEDHDKCTTIEIKLEDVRKRLSALREDKSAGADDLSPRLLKHISTEIAEPLTTIFNLSLREGNVPLDWRKANVAPIYKKGSKNLAENYRPVSLTSNLSKVLEALLRDEMVKHLDKHDLIRDSQHGFRSGRSCTTNLLAFLDQVTEIIDSGGSLDAVFLDFAKAFDTVPHGRLIAKLRAHGFGGQIVAWIEAWLKDRKQRVCLDGSRSGWRIVLSGVPQGSVLGPLLFLIFINDLDLNINSSVFKFADDTKIIGTVKDSTDSERLQADVDTLYQWAGTWQMKFNISKCKVMHLGRRNASLQYCMNGQSLEEVTSYRDLGVIMSSHLKVNEHCQEAYRKANRMLGLVKRTMEHRDPLVLVSLYKSLVRPHLEHCSPIWSPHFQKDKSLLEKVQHRFTRLFPELRSFSYNDRLKKLKLWTLEERRNRADLIELYKMSRGTASVPLQNFFTLAPQHVPTRGHSWKLIKPHCSTDVRRFFFSVRVINKWNSLPQETVDASSVNMFKNQLDRIRNSRMGFFMDS